MREIKFRAWNETIIDILEKPMEYYGDWNSIRHMARHKQYDDDIIIMQFTGLKDKNGKEIYEGDLINGKMFPKPVTIVYLEDRASFGWEYGNKAFGTMEDLMDTLEYEVIGNIYENKDLLC